MRSTGARVGLLVVLVAVAVVLFVVLEDDAGDDGGGDGSTTAGQTSEPAQPANLPPEAVEVRDGAVVGGVRTLTYEKGDEIRLLIHFDEPQENIHVHGYEIERENPGRTVRLDFPAKLDGIYELEAHGPSGDILLAELRVNP